MFNKYYQQELQNLRELAMEFSKVHPAIAPMLSGPTSDPDVERLLEGVAFLTGLLNRKLDNEFPEIIHGLMDIVFPHYLRPIPSTSIVVFSPKPSLKETINVPAGTSLASIPVEGTRCIFRTCFDTEVHPLELVSADIIREAEQPDRIRLVLDLKGLTLSQWEPQNLSFFLGESYAQACDLFFLLTKYVRRIILVPGEDGEQCVLTPDAIKQTGFQPGNYMLPFPTQSFSGYRLIQEYFILPQKFLFLAITDWEKWKNRGESSRFEINFELEPSPISLQRVRTGNFHLFATPVINLFSDNSDQVLLDHRLEKIGLRTATKSKEHYQIFSVDKVVGFEQGSVTQKDYAPLELFSHKEGDKSIYQVIRSRSPIDNSPEHFLSFTYPPEGPEPVTETLSLTLTFSNGALPERLQLGDICEQTSDSPGLLDFRNIISPTSSVEPMIGKNTLWKLLSHLSLNYLPIANSDNIKNLLKLYIATESRDRARTTANLKRVDGIQDFCLKPADRLEKGLVIRGQKLEMTVRHDYFASLGDLYLFASVMDLFLGVYSSMNTFIQFTLKDSISGETFTWPARIGDRPLT